MDQLTCASLSHTFSWYEVGTVKVPANVVVVVVYLALTVPLRIQQWSQDRRNQTKSNRKSEISRESRGKRTDKKVASKGHHRDRIEKHKQNHTDNRNKLPGRGNRIKRMEGSQAYKRWNTTQA